MRSAFVALVVAVLVSPLVASETSGSPARYARRFGVEPLPGTRMTIVEGAYTSPIWYTPS